MAEVLPGAQWKTVSGAVTVRAMAERACGAHDRPRQGCSQSWLGSRGLNIVTMPRRPTFQVWHQPGSQMIQVCLENHVAASRIKNTHMKVRSYIFTCLILSAWRNM